MNQTFLQRDSSANLHVLSAYIKSMDSTLAHLHHLIGGQIHHLDSSLTKTKGRTVHLKTGHVLHDTPLFSGDRAISTLMGSLGKGIAGNRGSTSGSGLSGGASASRGQMLSDVASAINRTMGRDL